MTALNAHLGSPSSSDTNAESLTIEPSVVEQARQWGYVLLAPHHPHCPGHAGLVFALHAKPGGAFFEPESVELWLLDARGSASRTRLDCMPQPRDGSQICPGPVTLYDRKGGRAHFLTFGGSLSLVTPDSPLICALRSPAPILELGDPTEPIMRSRPRSAEGRATSPPRTFATIVGSPTSSPTQRGRCR